MGARRVGLDVNRARAVEQFRRVLALYLVSAIFGCQLLFVLEQGLGLALPLGPTGPMMVAGIPALGIAAGLRFGWLQLPPRERSGEWLAIGIGLFGVWGTGYMLIGAAIDPERYRTFDGTLENQWPFWPDASLLYLSIHPLFLLPFVVISDERRVRALAVAVVAVLLISFASWTIFPVEMVRPAVDPSAPGFGEYVLRTIQRSDPSINCLPSTHCAMAALSSLMLYETRSALGAWMILTAIVIAAATLLTRQHYLVDVATGALVGGAAFAMARVSSPRAARQHSGRP